MACGGNAECCTCHVHLTKKIVSAQDYIEAEERELDALDWVDAGLVDESRLACQTTITKSFDGQNIQCIVDEDA